MGHNARLCCSHVSHVHRFFCVSLCSNLPNKALISLCPYRMCRAVLFLIKNSKSIVGAEQVDEENQIAIFRGCVCESKFEEERYARKRDGQFPIFAH